MHIKAYKIIFNFIFIHYFFVCLVSSQAISETFLRIFKALREISFKLPIGVPTIYKIHHFQVQTPLCEMMERIFI